MRSNTFAILLLSLAAACGGKSKAPTAGPANHDSGGGGGLDTAKIQTDLAAMEVPSGCGDPGRTIDAHFQEQVANLGGAGATDVSFRCEPPVDGLAECSWSVFARPDPAAATGGEDDPCGGECCSGYQVIFKVDGAGAIDPASVFCVAPG